MAIYKFRNAKFCMLRRTKISQYEKVNFALRNERRKSLFLND